MSDTYLATVTADGLVRLDPETEYAARFLLRRFSASVRPGLLYWVVLDRQDAEIIGALVGLGLYRDALRRLQTDAADGGSLLPETRLHGPNQRSDSTHA